MKKFIFFLIFAIGLMFTLPAESSGSKAPPGQCSFIADQSVDIAAKANDALVEPQLIASLQGNVSVITTPICRKGGGVDVQMFVSATQPTNLMADRVKRTATDFTHYYKIDFRICLTEQVSKLKGSLTKNIQAAGPVTIRKLTQV